MPSLLDSLIGGPPERKDGTRLEIKKRLAPMRPREIFDALATMGLNASTQSLLRGFEMKFARPDLLSYAVLGRWPTPQELAALPEAFKNVRHLRDMLVTPEFRGSLLRRLCDAFPEKQRLFLVRLPRSAGANAQATLERFHPVLPLHLDSATYEDLNTLVEKLGEISRLFGMTRTLAFAWDSMAPLIAPPPLPVADDPLRWHGGEPPFRAGDLLFAIMRPPLDVAFSQVNGVLTKLRQDYVVRLPEGLAPPPARADIAAWRRFGVQLLRHVIAKNPVCTALGDGTTAGTLHVCSCVPVTLVGLDRYAEWARSALGGSLDEKHEESEQIVRPADLSEDDTAWLEARVAEDQAFYTRFHARYVAAAVPAILGTDL